METMQWTPGGSDQDIEDRCDESGGSGRFGGFGGVHLGIGGMLLVGILSLIFHQKLFSIFSGSGPFYCPEDQKVYMDLGFFQGLENRFGAPGKFAQAYVIAHELAPCSAPARDRIKGPPPSGTGPTLSQSAFRAAQATSRLLRRCVGKLYRATEHYRSDCTLRRASNAAAAVGDDRLQRMTRGRDRPESFTHGSSAQHTAWFKRGLQSGRVSGYDTFATP